MYSPGKENKIQGYAEIINQQRGEFMITERNDIVKRIIINGQTGSSWFFKRFNRLTVIFTYFEDADKLFAS